MCGAEVPAPCGQGTKRSQTSTTCPQPTLWSWAMAAHTALHSLGALRTDWESGQQRGGYGAHAPRALVDGSGSQAGPPFVVGQAP